MYLEKLKYFLDAILNSTDHRGIGKLWRTFPNLGLEETYCGKGIASETNHRCDSSHVKAALRKLQIPFQEDHYIVQGNITPCIIGEDTDESNMLLDFLTHVIGFKQADSDLYKKVMACVKENCIENEGEFFFQSQSDMLILTK